MLLPHQIEPAEQALGILKKHHLVYLNAEMRVGKTTIALFLAHWMGYKKVLFVSSNSVKLDKVVEKDYNREGFTFPIDIINYESLHKITPGIYDYVVVDECHNLSAYPKPALRTKRLKQIIGNADCVIMTGTSHPQGTMSQLFHQFWVSAHSPFTEQNFYRWADTYVDVTQEHVRAGATSNNYDKAKEDLIIAKCGHLFVKKSQKSAGFKNIDCADTIIPVPIDRKIYKLAEALLKDRIYEMKSGEKIICDTAGSLQNKLHQIYSGTVQTERSIHILDASKALYIKKHYPTGKIVIFYKFIGEGELLRRVFADECTDSPREFTENESKRVFICQIRSGSLGINLSVSNIIIYYNIDFSYETYAQSRARIQAHEKTDAIAIHWLFAEHGIEDKIYKVICQKKDYNIYYFNQDFSIKAG